MEAPSTWWKDNILKIAGVEAQNVCRGILLAVYFFRLMMMYKWVEDVTAKSS